MKRSLRSSGVQLIGALALLAALAPVDRAFADFTRETIATGLTAPLYVAAPPGDTDRLFVVERNGLIKIIDLNTNTVLPTPFLDVNDSPNTDVSAFGEGGLLSMAFHPNYSANGFFFVYYTTDVAGIFTSRVSRFTVSSNPDLADAASETVFFEVSQPFPNHKGGTIGFRPGDANHYLYLGLGDGGGGCDPSLNGQNLNSKLGKMLRFDVDAGPSGDILNPFAPPSNPFVGVAGDDLIWDFGLRNPFRWSFDRLTGDLIIADVGQGRREEIDFELANNPGGVNYGWNAREGSLAAIDCNNALPTLPEMVDPIYDYDHNGASASITGGNVYRGSRFASMYGRYFFADFVTRNVWSGVAFPTGIADLRDHTAALNPGGAGFAGFGEDAAGNIYMVNIGGTVYRIIDPTSPPVGTGGGGSGGQCFVATAAYGTPLANRIGVLRDWRDADLLPTPIGAAFVDTYYRLSPPAAGYIATRPTIRATARMVITPITGLVAQDDGIYTGVALSLLFVLTLSAAVFRKRRREV